MANTRLIEEYIRDSGYKLRHVAHALNSGEIPAFKIGKLWKVYKKDLIQYLRQDQKLKS